METIIFDNKEKPPQDKDIAKALGKTKTLWDDLHAHLGQEYAPVSLEWKFYSGKFGWTCKVVHKKRTIVHLRADQGSIMVVTTFGEKAVAAALQSKLPKKIKTEITEARKYAEGRPVRVDVKTKKDLDHVKLIAAIKMAN
ncbi:DUF3788 domain-containing protein [Candidatus Zixiibacteriota bacterium]